MSNKNTHFSQQHRWSRVSVRGFTLVELLVTLTIAAILLAVAMPSFNAYIQNVRLRATSSELVADINRARSEATKRNVHVLLCRRTAANVCTTGTDWSNGWLVCIDADADGTCDASTASTPNPIRVRTAMPTGVALAGPAAAVVVLSTGGVSAAATFVLRSSNSTTTTYTHSVALSGSVSVLKQ